VCATMVLHCILILFVGTSLGRKQGWFDLVIVVPRSVRWGSDFYTCYGVCNIPACLRHYVGIRLKVKLHDTYEIHPSSSRNSIGVLFHNILRKSDGLVLAIKSEGR
jgi:hypothetical protein